MKTYSEMVMDSTAIGTCSRMDLVARVAAATLAAVEELASKSVTDIRVDYAGEAYGGGYVVRLVGETAE